MYSKIKNIFNKVLVNSLNTGQVNYLGERYDSTFDLYKESGFRKSMPIPQQTAADTLLRYFRTEEDIVHLFTILLQNEGDRFYNTNLAVWGKIEFIKLLQKYKWIYDPELVRFFLDPFYENEINFLSNIRVLDLRNEYDHKKIINGFTNLCKKMGTMDLDWRITLRLYDLDRNIAELIRKIIELLLTRQNLQSIAFQMFTCLKELAINASKANYKLLFEKYYSRKLGVTADNSYFHFLRLFKEEIEENGNSRLLDLAKDEDKYINITFQSTQDAIEIWVTNTQNISIVEKQEILKRLGQGELDKKKFGYDEEEYAEGAGLGINIILSVLNQFSDEPNPLNVIFYPHFIKIGFELKREDVLAKLKAAEKEKEDTENQEE